MTDATGFTSLLVNIEAIQTDNRWLGFEVTDSGESEISGLPPHLQAEVLEFVQFVKQRHDIAKVSLAASNSQIGGDSPFFQALSDAGFVGCIETNEQLSTSYKQHIDFSAKVGVQA